MMYCNAIKINFFVAFQSFPLVTTLKLQLELFATQLTKYYSEFDLHCLIFIC